MPAAAAAADGRFAAAAASHPAVAGEPAAALCPAALCPAAAVWGRHSPEVHSAVETCQLAARCLWWAAQLPCAWAAQLGDSSELLSRALL